jgi:ATPase subunit of ABC transporter with duplicated ATPase domains
LLDEPTNHLDADSITWLRSFLSAHDGRLVVISHDTELLAAVVNKVWFLDATRGEVDVYNMGWHKYLDARATDEQRRRRERANAERKASALRAQAAKMGAKATKAVAAQNMLRRADRMMAALDEERVADKVARIKFPTPAPCGRTPLVAKGLTKNYGSLEVFTGVDLAIDRGSRVVVLGLNGAGKTAAPCWPAPRSPTRGGRPRAQAADGLLRRSTTLDMAATVWENVRHLAGHPGAAAACWERHVRREQQGSVRTSGGERTRLAGQAVSSAATSCCSTSPKSNLTRRAASRSLDALRHRGRRRAGDPRSRRRRGTVAGQGHRASGRHRGPLVSGLPRARSARMTFQRARGSADHPTA